MPGFSFESTNIEEVKVVLPFFQQDERGFFLKSYEKEIFGANGIAMDVFEDFESYSHRGVVRGLHFQTKLPQAKLVRTVTGEIFDVAVDLRKNAKTYGKWVGVRLSAHNRKALFIPKGFAHGFLVLSEFALVSYKCCGKYMKDDDSGIFWEDPDLCIAWPKDKVKQIIISQKDAELQSFQKFNQEVFDW